MSPKVFLNLFKLCKYCILYKMAHLTGVEPIAFWSVVRRSIQLSYRCMYIFSILLLKKNGGEGGIWTLDPSFSPDTPLAGERIRPLCHFSTYINQWRVNRDSNPESFRLAGFQDRSLSRSDIHPHWLWYYSILFINLSTSFIKFTKI